MHVRVIFKEIEKKNKRVSPSSIRIICGEDDDSCLDKSTAGKNGRECPSAAQSARIWTQRSRQPKKGQYPNKKEEKGCALKRTKCTFLVKKPLWTNHNTLTKHGKNYSANNFKKKIEVPIDRKHFFWGEWGYAKRVSPSGIPIICGNGDGSHVDRKAVSRRSRTSLHNPKRAQLETKKSTESLKRYHFPSKKGTIVLKSPSTYFIFFPVLMKKHRFFQIFVCLK